MASLILVRHAMPVFGPEAQPHEWELGAQGRAAAAALVGVLPADAVLVSSAEPKARQTLEPLGSVSPDERFNEVWRVGEPFGGAFRELRAAYVSGVDHSGWESRDEVIARFAAGVHDWLARVDGRPLVVAGHGMAMTVWLTAVVGLSEPAAFWAGLRFPHPLRVDLAGRTVTEM